MNEFVKEHKTRPFGSKNRKYYVWNVIIFDKETNEIKEGKFSTIKEMNEVLNLNINHELAYRLHTKFRADLTGSKLDNSFIKKYGHIKLEKIKEIRI